MLGKILFLYSMINIGDVAHVDSIFQELSHKIKPIERYNLDANQAPESLVKQYESLQPKLGTDPYILFAVGEKGLQALEDLYKRGILNCSHTYIAVGVHQYFKHISTLPLNYLAIPAGAIDTKEKKNNIQKIPRYTLTFGVPTSNPTLDKLKEAYDTWEIPQKPSLEDDYIVVFLPGDAPDSSNKMKYFTKKSAYNLFKNIYSLWKQKGSRHKIIVQNGPRTGRFNPETGGAGSSHEYLKGGDPTAAIDDVSKYFVKLLDEKKVPYFFYNFAFEVAGDTKKPLSVFNQLLYIAQSSLNNYFILPGESVSMLGQIPLYMMASNIIVFKPDSMNETHEKIFKMVQRHGYLSYFSSQGKVIASKNTGKRTQDDAAEVVEEMLKGYAMKFERK